jgi:ubiquinone/menaquinone biosynthesis C-methylase UbiE
MANYFKTRYSFDKGRFLVWKAISEFIQQFIDEKNDAILDIGSGYCDFINNIVCKKKFAVDINKDCGLFCAKDVIFYRSSITNLEKIKPNSIDVIFASNLLEHFTDAELELVLKELRRVLKKKSRVIVLQPNYKYAYKEYFDDYTHKKIFSHVSIIDFFESNGFKTYKCFPRFLPFSLKSFLPKSYLLTKIYLWSFYKPMAKQMLLVFDRANEK